MLYLFQYYFDSRIKYDPHTHPRNANHGHQNKSLLFSQILRYNLSAMCIQMIGRLIQSTENVPPSKTDAPRRTFSFSPREDMFLKRTPKHFFRIHFRTRQVSFPYLPLFCLRTHLVQKFHRPLLLIYYRIRKIIKPNGFYNFPPILVPDPSKN